MSKIALVTGVTRGIGKAIAERFLREGYIVHGTYFTSESKGRELQQLYGADKLFLHGPYDFCDPVQTQRLVEELSAFTFDAVVPSAGMFYVDAEGNGWDDFNDFNLDIFNKTMNCNFYAPLIITTGLIKNINDGGSIVIMSSNDAFPGAYASMSYSISKSAVISLMKCLAVNYGTKKVRVNAVAPGAIDTDMNTTEQMEISPYFTPISRVGTPNDVAKAVFFLASDEASFINGETVTIDGGYNIVSILLKSEADTPLSENIREFIKERTK